MALTGAFGGPSKNFRRLDAVGFHFAYEAVSAPGQRLNITWFFGRFTKCVTEPFHRCVDAVIKLNYGVAGPELLADLFAEHDFARTFEQGNEYLEGLLLQADLEIVLPQLCTPQMQYIRTETNDRRWGDGLILKWLSSGIQPPG